MTFTLNETVRIMQGPSTHCAKIALTFQSNNRVWSPIESSIRRELALALTEMVSPRRYYTALELTVKAVEKAVMKHEPSALCVSSSTNPETLELKSQYDLKGSMLCKFEIKLVPTNEGAINGNQRSNGPSNFEVLYSPGKTRGGISAGSESNPVYDFQPDSPTGSRYQDHSFPR